MNATHDRAKSIFLNAAEIATADERAKFIEAECQNDESLRREVEELLRHQQGLGSFLESPAVDLPVTTDAAPISERPGTVIGPYKLLQQIGEGGLGVVFMAEQTEPIQRTAALKIIKPGMDTRQVIARFEAERQAVAMMDHPNIAKVLDAGTTESGRPYFVMELVKGVPITKYCDEKHLPLRARLELFVQVCQAVQHAHQKGIIHRDIKPNNVLVAEYDHHAVPKVIDFGVAKATAQKLTERTMFTEFGQVLGTMEYMSPEQSKFNQLDIDTRSDIYSLGVLLYELLAGSTPFEGKRLHEAAFDEMLRIIREEEPPKPSTRLTASDMLPSIAANRHIDPARLSKDLRGDLDWIVMKALEKDRNRRYETASGFAADIERHLHDEPVEAGPPSAAYRFRKFARRHKRALTAGAMFAVVLVAATAFSILQAVRATRAEHSAAAEAQRARTEAATARAVNDFLMRDLLAQADPYIPFDRYKETGAELKLLTVLKRAAANIEGRFPDQPLVEAALRQTIGYTYNRLGDSSKAVLHLTRAVELRRAHLGEEHRDTLESMASLARAKDDPELTTHVLEVRRRILGRDDPATLSSMFSMAMATDKRGEKSDALKLFREVLEAQRRVLGEDHTSTAWTKHLVACVQRPLDGVAGPDGAHGAEIERLYREALATMRAKAGDGSWHTYDITLRLGQFLNVPGHYERAEPVFQDGYSRLQSQPVAPPEWAATLAGELSGLYRSWNKPERAAEWELKRIAGNESALARTARLLREQPDDTIVLASRASLLSQVKRHAEAAATYRAAIELNPKDPWLRQFLGDAYSAQGRFTEAEAAFREAIRLAPNEGLHHQNLADAFLRQGKLIDAAAEYTDAIRLRPTEQGPHYGLGSAYAYGGQWNKAAVEFQRAMELSPNDMWSVYRWASLCLYTNDVENYRRACRAMLDHFSQTEDVTNADCTAKACAPCPVLRVTKSRSRNWWEYQRLARMNSSANGSL